MDPRVTRRMFGGPVLDLRSHQPDRRTPVADAEFLAVDFETTGIDPRRHQIVSMGWLPIVAGGRINLSQARHHVIAGVDVGQSAVLHGITDTHTAQGTPLATALEELRAALEGRLMLAHFAALETGFMDAAAQRVWGCKVRLHVVDTFQLERRHMERMGTYPRGEDLRLPRVRARYHLPHYASHNALTDAQACAELFLAQLHATRAVVVGDILATS